MNADRLIRRLEVLLKAQSKSLQTGNLNAAFAASPGIEKLIERLESTASGEVSARGMASLRDQAKQNADHIVAARDGVEAARRLLEQIDQNKSFQAYDAQGKSQKIGS